MPINDRFLIYTNISYIDYGNIACVSTSQNKQKEIFIKQNMLFQLYFTKKRKLMQWAFLEEIHALNVYQIKILQILIFEHF